MSNKATTDYENERNARIQANLAMLSHLGIDSAKRDIKSACATPSKPIKPIKARTPKEKIDPEFFRRSDRAASLPKVCYMQETLEGEIRDHIKKQRKRMPLISVEDKKGEGPACARCCSPVTPLTDWCCVQLLR